jgi:hypothetical protein
MPNDTRSPGTPRSRWQRFWRWAGGLALVLGLVILSIVLAELGPVRDLCAWIDVAREMYPGLIGIPIGLLVVGGVLMLGAQFLPAPRLPSPPPNEALDGAAVSMEVREERERWSRSMEMEASTGEVREAWQRRSWRYSRNWRFFFVMMLGAVLVGAGITGLFILIGPPWVKVLVAGLAGYVVVRILWEFAVK